MGPFHSLAIITTAVFILAIFKGTAGLSCRVCKANVTLAKVKTKCPLQACEPNETACKATYSTDDQKKGEKVYNLHLMCVDPVGREGKGACVKRLGISSCMCLTDGCNHHGYDGCKCLAEVKAPPKEESQQPNDKITKSLTTSLFG